MKFQIPILGESIPDALRKAMSSAMDQLIKIGRVEGGLIIIPDNLGDHVAAILKPVARGIDSVVGTDLENCKECAKEQARLNELTKPKDETNGSHQTLQQH